MSDFYDSLEIRAPEDREREIFSELPGLLRHAKANAGAYAERLADVDPLEVGDRAALAALPVTRKSEMAGHQAAAPPFGDSPRPTSPSSPGCSSPPGRYSNPRRAETITGGWRGPFMRPGCAAVTSSTTASPTT